MFNAALKPRSQWGTSGDSHRQRPGLVWGSTAQETRASVGLRHIWFQVPAFLSLAVGQ